MAIDYGTDTSSFAPDGSLLADFGGEEISGVRVVLEESARIIMTPLGSIFYATGRGVPHTVQSLQNSTRSDSEIARVAIEWGAAVKEQVEFVTGASFKIARAVDGKGFNFTGSIRTADGVFPLVGFAGDVVRVLFPK